MHNRSTIFASWSQSARSSNTRFLGPKPTHHPNRQRSELIVKGAVEASVNEYAYVSLAIYMASSCLLSLGLRLYFCRCFVEHFRISPILSFMWCYCGNTIGVATYGDRSVHYQARYPRSANCAAAGHADVTNGLPYNWACRPIARYDVIEGS